MTDVDGFDPVTLRELAEDLVAEAAAHVRRRRPEVFGAASSGSDAAVADGPTPVSTKSTPTDPVTVVDTETERLLRRRLAQLRPGDAVLGEEEGGPEGAARGAVTWVLDPVDGTVNFVYGIPAYGVSVAAVVDGESVAGAVADVTAAVVYSAARGEGAHVTDIDGRRTALRAGTAAELSLALVGTGFGYAAERRAAQAHVLTEVLPAVRDVRRIGAASLDLCAVASGRLDAYYEHGLQWWDWAAGALVATEAGASVRPPRPGGALVAAGSPAVAAALAELLGRRGALDDLPAAPGR